MTFIVATLNHFRAVQAWAQANDAEVQLDVLTFEMEVKARHRYFSLKPQFLASMDGRFAHVPTLTPEATGLIGWLPYRPPLRWDVAGDKLTFKSLIAQSGFKTPDWWTEPARAESDHILKRSRGSFGYELYGPYRTGALLPAVPAESRTGQIFAERFIHGRNVKLWFWGEAPFFAHVHDYPTATGDGASSVRQLVDRRLQRVGRALDDSAEASVILQALAYQGHGLDDVPAEGEKFWLDYRYGRTFTSSPVTSQSDNALGQLGSDAQGQAQALGRFLASELLKVLPAPVLCSVDAVLDAQGTLWWLEMNSNPILPPDGYPLILSTLFGDGGRG